MATVVLQDAVGNVASPCIFSARCSLFLSNPFSYLMCFALVALLFYLSYFFFTLSEVIIVSSFLSIEPVQARDNADDLSDLHSLILEARLKVMYVMNLYISVYTDGAICVHVA